MDRYFLTTAIDYANGRPHLGHAYEKVLADTIARYRRNRGADVFFLTGVDEHGQKVQQSARTRGVAPQEFVDEIAGYFKDMCAALGISNSRFVRTTDPMHVRAVQGFLRQLFETGQIYRKDHQGFYSVRQEQFVSERDMVDGRWPEIFGEVIEMSEPAYFYEFGKHQEWLRAHIRANPDFIRPAFRANEVLAALERPLGDLCISRPRKRLEWGIPLPFDEDYVTYVWFDALSNYVTFAHWGEEENRWPCDLHIIGKDILVPAHAVYWPIMLRGIGIPLPKGILVHGFWLSEGSKLSKSTGKVIDPMELVAEWGAEAFRYYVMREMAVGYDANMSLESFAARYKSDLANDLGNLVNRGISMIRRYRDGRVPAVAMDVAVASLASEVVAGYTERMEAFEVHRALEHVWRLVARANQYVDETAPWKLAKDPGRSPELDTVLLTLAEAIRLISVLVEPVLPGSARAMQNQLGMKEFNCQMTAALPDGRSGGTVVGDPSPLFPRKD